MIGTLAEIAAEELSWLVDTLDPGIWLVKMSLSSRFLLLCPLWLCLCLCLGLEVVNSLSNSSSSSFSRTCSTPSTMMLARTFPGFNRGDTGLAVIGIRSSLGIWGLVITLLLLGHLDCLCNVMPYFRGWWPRSQFWPASVTIWRSFSASRLTPTKHSLPGMSLRSV